MAPATFPSARFSRRSEGRRVGVPAGARGSGRCGRRIGVAAVGWGGWLVGSKHWLGSWWGGLLADGQEMAGGPAGRWFGWEVGGAGVGGSDCLCQRSGCLVGGSALRPEGLRRGFAPLSLAIGRQGGFQVPRLMDAPRVLASPVASMDCSVESGGISPAGPVAIGMLTGWPCCRPGGGSSGLAVDFLTAYRVAHCARGVNPAVVTILEDLAKLGRGDSGLRRNDGEGGGGLLTGRRRGYIGRAEWRTPRRWR